MGGGLEWEGRRGMRVGGVRVCGRVGDGREGGGSE